MFSLVVFFNKAFAMFSEIEVNRGNSYLKQKFSEYYRDNFEKNPFPSSIDRREFGFISFRERMMIRHKGFTNSREFKNFMNVFTPSDIYYSAAYYEKPEEAMEKKGWLGADLIFDIDADHLSTPCKSEHDYWICENCQNTGRGTQPEKCPKCSGNKFKNEAWLCETCLDTAKTETLKLIDFIIKDFGFSANEVESCFSGHRGYHVHIEKESVRQLNQAARKEIVDYITGTGLNVEFHGLNEITEKRTHEIIGPRSDDSGWDGRIARGVYESLGTSSTQQIEQIEGINKSEIKILTSNKDNILEGWYKNKQPWNINKKISLETWEKLAYHGAKKQTSSIDTVVTTDIHRLIRMPSTLHGKTGLKAVSIPLDKLKDFDPFTEAIAFNKGSVRVYINEAYKFRLGNNTFGPYNRQIEELPMAAAIYLLCKKAAKLVD